MGLLLKRNDGYGLEVSFRLNSNSRACLQRSGIKFISYYTNHSEIFERSWFRVTVPVVISCVVENQEVSPAKGFALGCKLFHKLFM